MPEPKQRRVVCAAQNGEPFEHMLDGLLPISVDEEGFGDD